MKFILQNIDYKYNMPLGSRCVCLDSIESEFLIDPSNKHGTIVIAEHIGRKMQTTIDPCLNIYTERLKCLS